MLSALLGATKVVKDFAGENLFFNEKNSMEMQLTNFQIVYF